MRPLNIGALLVAGFISGCGGGTSGGDGKTIAAIDGLTEKVGSLEQKVKELEAANEKLFFDKLAAELSGPQESLLFDPQDNKGYQAARAPAGSVLVVLEKLEPYLDGYTVSLRFGNPTTAEYSGVKGKVKWGRLYDSKKDQDFNKLLEKEIDLKDDLKAGSWTIVKFNIAPAKPDEVRRLIIQPTFDHLKLRTLPSNG